MRLHEAEIGVAPFAVGLLECGVAPGVAVGGPQESRSADRCQDGRRSQAHAEPTASREILVRHFGYLDPPRSVTGAPA